MAESTVGNCAKASREAPDLGHRVLLGVAGRGKKDTLMVQEVLPNDVQAGQHMGCTALEKLGFLPVISTLG